MVSLTAYICPSIPPGKAYSHTRFWRSTGHNFAEEGFETAAKIEEKASTARLYELFFKNLKHEFYE